MTIVPAVMALLGGNAWWLPRWQDRILPQVDVEASSCATQLEGQSTTRRLEPAHH